jgi:predicted transposase/invertase (TIGR01784 family)
MDESALHNPHDAFIKAGLGKPGQMAAFLQAYLPPALTVAVDWSSLQPMDKGFLDEALHHRHADLLFTARFHGKPVFFQILFEHQKTVDRWMPLRLLTYQLRIWERYRERNPKARHLPPILPIVFFQDRKKWTPSPHFRDLLDLPESIDSQWLAFLPDFQHATINLSGLPLDPIAENLALRVMIKVLSAILDPDPANAFKTGLRALADLENAPDHHTFLRICLTYLTQAGNTLDRKTLYTIINEQKSTRLKDEAMTIAEQLIQEGRQEGRQEGERILLRRQMTRKFGDLSFEILEKIEHAREEDLERWSEAIFDASSPEDLVCS